MPISCSAVQHYVENGVQLITLYKVGVGLVTQEKNKANQTDGATGNLQQEDVERDETTRPVEEIGGPKGLEPTRYGDWERKGRCIDF